MITIVAGNSFPLKKSNKQNFQFVSVNGTKREFIHQSWMRNETQVVVATIAFGLGKWAPMLPGRIKVSAKIPHFLASHFYPNQESTK